MDPIETKKACARSYATFCQVMQEDGWFDDTHKRLCNWIQYHVTKAFEQNIDCKLGIIMPRGTLKSTMVTKYFPLWSVLESEDVPWKSCNLRSLISTNTHTNARKKLEGIRGIVDAHKIFRSLWQEVLPKKSNRWTDECAEITRTLNFDEGTFEACGLGSKKIGTHYNIICEDDTTAPDESDIQVDITLPSLDTISKAIAWHQAGTSLLVPKGLRVRLVVSTRWSEFDLIRHIKEKEGYKIFDVAAISKETGFPNFPDLYDYTRLDEIKSQVGSFMFSMLYLNEPLSASQRVFRDECIKYVGISEIPEGGYYSIAVDPAISEKEQACETCISLVKHYHESPLRHLQYWIKAEHGRWQMHETISRTLKMASMLEDAPLKGILVEINAFQLVMKVPFFESMAHLGVNFPFWGINRRRSKVEHITAMQPHFESGQIFFVKGLSAQVESQLKQFPNGNLVDIIDSFSMHLKLHKREKTPEKELVKEEKSFLSCDTLLEDMEKRQRDYGRLNGLRTGLTRSNNIIYGLATGLGKKRDLQLLAGRN